MQLHRPGRPPKPPLGHLLELVRSRTEFVEEAARLVRPGIAVGDQRQRRALRDRAGEQPVGRRAGQQREHRGSPRRLTEDRHPFGVTPERGDVLAHPTQRGQLIAQAQVVVETRTERTQLEAPEHPDPVSDVDHDDTAVGGQPGAVVQLQLPGAVDERTTGDPHHHWQRTRGVR